MLEPFSVYNNDPLSLAVLYDMTASQHMVHVCAAE